MTSPFEVWRRNLWIWGLPLGFCLLNVFGFAVYRTAFAGKVETLEKRYERASDQLAALEKERLIVEQFLHKLETRKGQVAELYRDHFPTQRQRFTQVIQEVKNLAAQAGLEPESLSYPQKELGEQQLVERTIKFRVNGTYDQLRRFINFLELSDEFLTLRSVTLSEAGQGIARGLGINLELSTIFAAHELEPATETELSTETESVPVSEEPST